MVKSVKISGKNYDMKSSAFTVFSYKDKTGNDLLKDLNELNSKQLELEKLPEEEREQAWLVEITPMLEKILKLAHIMICEQDKTFKSYEEWLKEIDNLMEDSSWIAEVMELATSPFSRGVIK